jgi:hypothetical protein
MIAALDLAVLLIFTAFAAVVAFLFDWLMLRLALFFMRPAIARQAAVRGELARGASQLTRAFVSRR